MGWLLIALALLAGVWLAWVLVFKGALIGMPANQRLETFGPVPFLEGNRKPLDANKLQKRIVKVATKGAVFVSVTGERRAVPHVVVEVSVNDHETLAALPQPLERTAKDIAVVVEQRLQRQRVVFSSDVSVEISSSPTIGDGRPQVQSRAKAQSNRTLVKTKKMVEPNVLPTQAATVWMEQPSIGSARLIAEDSGHENFGIPANPEVSVSLGRAGELKVDHPEVSAHHATLVHAKGMWTIVDLDSTNGTFVNGRVVAQSRLDDGDRIRFGPAGPSYVFTWE